MQTEDYILDALETVLAWDVPDELFVRTLTDEAKRRSGLSADEMSVDPPEDR